jgi:hypothetical protein
MKNNENKNCLPPRPKPTHTLTNVAPINFPPNASRSIAISGIAYTFVPYENTAIGNFSQQQMPQFNTQYQSNLREQCMSPLTLPSPAINPNQAAEKPIIIKIWSDPNKP